MKSTSTFSSFVTTMALMNGLANAFTINVGQVIEFTSPDDLFLDPATHLIAVNVVNDTNPDLVVNGVTFLGDGGLNEVTGTSTNNGITVVTSRASATAGGGELSTWAEAPAFTGGEGDSATNLGLIMQSIRWADTEEGGGLAITISGLTPNQVYDLQLLFNEGRLRNRRFDIAVEDQLVVDDFSTQGGDQAYTANNSFAYRGTFISDETGMLDIRLERDIGGDEFQGDDGNPTIQGIILHNGPPEEAPTDISLSNMNVVATAALGTMIGTFSSEDVNITSHTYSLVAGEGDTDNSKFQIDANDLQTGVTFDPQVTTTHSIRVRSTDPAGLFFEKVFTINISADADGDNLEDPWEQNFAGNLTDLNGLVSGPGPGADTGDFDGDGSSDLDEQNNGTDPTDPDSDDDGSNDGEEATNGTDPNDPDSDDDNLSDGDEIALMTDPLDSDSDDDTFLDGDEVARGTDPNIFSRTNVIAGRVIEFKGPDDLDIDPAKALIAVNVNGESDLDVNGVSFFADRSNNGVVTQGGITVTTTAENEILTWADAPLFTGADAPSALNLGEVMRSIRWSLDPAPLDIKVEGLAPGVTYEIQLLFNEGSADRVERVWDITVEDNLVIDNFTSLGVDGEGEWTNDNSFAYVGEFTIPVDGILDIKMMGDLGGNPQFAGGNPILQGLVVNNLIPTELQVTDIDVDLATEQVTLTWNSKPGRSYTIDFVEELGDEWMDLEDGAQSDGFSTSFPLSIPQTFKKGFFRVREN